MNEINLIDKIMSKFSLELEFIEHTKAISRRQIKQISIPKNNGGFRIIRIPPVESKLIQYAIVDVLSSVVSISRYATAYHKGASIRNNALIHASAKYFLRIDLKDFFPSIKFTDFKKALTQQSVSLTDDSWNLILKTCFDVSDRLSIGFPASPFVCNVVMKSFDENVASKIEAETNSVKYSRYSDDLVISANTIEEIETAKIAIENLIKLSESPKIRIHYKKTRKMNLLRGNVIITGVKIRTDHSLTVHPKIRDDARFLLNLVKLGKINDDNILRLHGLMNYIKGVDSDLYNRLLMKNINPIAKLEALYPIALNNKHKANATET